jgi:hypothetical protein
MTKLKETVLDVLQAAALIAPITKTEADDVVIEAVAGVLNETDVWERVEKLAADLKLAKTAKQAGGLIPEGAAALSLPKLSPALKALLKRLIEQGIDLLP